MIKKIHLYAGLFLLLGLTLPSLLSSCGKDDDKKDEPDMPTISDQLSLSSNKLTLHYDKNSTVTFTINSNTRWTISYADGAAPDWLLLSSTSGSGNASIVVTALSANNSSSSRSATIMVSAGSIAEELEITQLGAFTSTCNITMDNWLILNSSVAFDMHLGKDVSYYYAMWSPVSESAGWTDEKVVNYLEANATAQDASLDTSAMSFQDLESSTEYYIYAVGYDSAGNRGDLTREKIRTKPSKGTDPWVYITDLKLDDTYFYWTTKPDGYTSKYYQAIWGGDTAFIIYYFGEAFAAYYMRESIDKGNLAVIAREDSWLVTRDGDNDFTVVTWGLDADNQFSSQVNMAYYTDSFSGSRVKAKTRSVKAPTSNQREMAKKNLKLYKVK